MASEKASGTDSSDQDRTRDTRHTISSVENIKTCNDEQEMLKDTILS